MDMKNILQNMDAAASGDKPSAGAKDVNDMNTILESIQECGSPMMAGQEMPMASEAGQPVTVSITASGKDNVSDLIAMMQDAAGITQMGPAVTDEPKMLPTPDGDKDMDMAAMRDIIIGPDQEDEVEEDGYDNAPDPEYKDHHYMTKDLSGGLNREKKAYKATQDGDNPMAVEDDSNDLETRIKEELQAALEAKYGKKKSKCSECGNEVAEEDEEYVAEKQRLDPKCWKGKKIGNPKTKMKGGVRVNNCVPA
jgi:hypothetical protein